MDVLVGLDIVGRPEVGQEVVIVKEDTIPTGVIGADINLKKEI